MSERVGIGANKGGYTVGYKIYMYHYKKFVGPVADVMREMWCGFLQYRFSAS